MGDVIDLKAVNRPVCATLIKALDAQIEEIATGKMTPLEVLGVLAYMQNQYYEIVCSVAATEAEKYDD